MLFRAMGGSSKASVCVGCVTGLLLAVAVESFRVTAGGNLHTVIPARVYRCAQPSPARLEELVRRNQIRTVVNLRGCSVPLSWYVDESRTTHRLNISEEDIAFSASRYPSVTEFRRLVQVLDRAEYPILLHCRQGADRTGLASAAVLLLQPGVSFERARTQLGVRYGHFRFDRGAYLDRFLTEYQEWLAAEGIDHSPARFRRWVMEEPCPNGYDCSFHWLQLPERLSVGSPAELRVRLHNTGHRLWRFCPETNAGYHVVFAVRDQQNAVIASGRAGLFDAQVPPGSSIDLRLVLPSLKRAGRYRLFVDMWEEQHCWFSQVGSEPTELELKVDGGDGDGEQRAG
jgi:hypothetical protein